MAEAKGQEAVRAGMSEGEMRRRRPPSAIEALAACPFASWCQKSWSRPREALRLHHPVTMPPDRVRTVLSCLWLAAPGLAAILVATAPAPAEAPVNDRARLLKEFSDRAAKYVELQRKARATVPPLPKKAEPERIAAHQKALAQAVRASRSGARQGEIFFPEVVPIFLEVLRSDLAGPDGRPAREAIKDGNPRVEAPPARPAEAKPKPVALVANARYPEGAPLSTVPPELLAKLPKLEEPLEYRFVGGHLILHDSEARLVVDFLNEVVP
jgi:hypothetical protein